MKKRFVKSTLTGYKDVPGGYSDPELEYVILSKDEYADIIQKLHNAERNVQLSETYRKSENRDWKGKYDKLYEAYVSWKKHAEDLVNNKGIPDGMAVISQEELNGYNKAIRIVRDRALQQIDKSKADEHGYTLLRADYREYDRSGYKGWLVTKSTPYSIKIPMEDAFYMIKTDLMDFYNFQVLPQVEDDCGRKRILSSQKLLQYFEKYYVKKEDILFNDRSGREIIGWVEGNGKNIAFEISKFSRNAASGCYEVSYWATGPI